MRKIRGWIMGDIIEVCVCITAPKRCKEHRLYSFQKSFFSAEFFSYTSVAKNCQYLVLLYFC